MHDSHWNKTAELPRFPALSGKRHVDVAVIGGGIAGATAAYLIKKAGLSVALLERSQCGGNDTSSTTAHVTYVTDVRLSKLVRNFGRDHAQAVWDAGQAAMDTVREIAQTEKIDCDLSWSPGYLHASLEEDGSDERQGLQEEAELAADLGFSATYLDSVPLVNRPGVRFANQARFHPLKFLAGLLPLVNGDGSHVFEESDVVEFEDEPKGVRTAQGSVSCGYVVIATHVPLMGQASLVGATLFQSKLAPYTSYAVGARLGDPTPEAVFWDTADPYNYLRIDRFDGEVYAILGGQDHKTGQADDTQDRFRRLADLLHQVWPEATIVDRWSGQVIETHDGLPFIGETGPGQFIATGFSGNGMTFGVLSAMMARDAAVGGGNPWRELFSPGRKALRAGAWNYLKENLDYPYYMVKDRLAAAEGNSVRSVRRGEGKILNLDGKRTAVYCDEDGKVTRLSPACTHMGCIVHWNRAERTWDCPCHGSRFHPTGEVLAGPAEESLSEQQADAPTAAR
jgi:glycine/D-amino acid oxidase-like deaminating enzyme/nitrite reductase/ring-hydroxylating ferredoxin subunit